MSLTPSMFMAASALRALRFSCLLSIALAAAVGGCGSKTPRSTATAPLTAEERERIWVEPRDIASRNLFYGVGGEASAPKAGAIYRVTGQDTAGHSWGYDLEDADGHDWAVKLGDEVQSEIVASRLLWAIGFHQPAMYFVRDWQAEGSRPEDQGRAARFRLEDGYKVETSWSWHENPYVGTRELKGLLVANLLLNNWDLKGTQNRIYLLEDEAAVPRTRYVVQDLGAALGASRWPTGNRNNIGSFERQALIDRVERGVVRFDYAGRHRELLEDITPADVVWTCQLFARLSDAQWKDAFRAANYPDAIASRFIAKLGAKVQEGLALSAETKAVQ